MIYEGSIVHVSKGWMQRKSCMYICWWCHMHWTQSCHMHWAQSCHMHWAQSCHMDWTQSCHMHWTQSCHMHWTQSSARSVNTIICQISHQIKPTNKQTHDIEPYLWNCTFISGANFFIQRNMGDVRDDRDSCEVMFLSFPHLMSHPAAVSAITVLAVLTEHWGFPLTLVTDVFNRGLFHLKLLHA